jgi:hypothetical protein
MTSLHCEMVDVLATPGALTSSRYAKEKALADVSYVSRKICLR